MGTIERYMVIFGIKSEGSAQTVKEMKKIGEQQGFTIRKMAEQKKSMASMRGDILSVMFAGMALQRMFGSQVSRVAELTGQKDIIDAFFTIAMVKPMAKITEGLAWLLTKFGELGPGVQTAAGIAILGLNELGALLSAGGSLGLAIIGLKELFTGLGLTAAATATKIGTDFTTAGAVAGSGLINGIVAKLGITAATLVTGGWIIAGAVAIVIAASTWKELSDLDKELERLQSKRIATIGATGMDPYKKTSSERLATGAVGMETITSSGPLPGISVGGVTPRTSDQIMDDFNNYFENIALKNFLNNANNKTLFYIN